MQMEKTPMPEQPANIRNKNFKEVSLGYSAEDAQNEALRCLGCRNKPCVEGCPVSVEIPSFISEIAKGNYEGAYRILKQSNTLPAVCGRVCPQESQCESKCVRGIKGGPVAIGRLERFAADQCMDLPAKKVEITPKNKKVAIIGSGPAGLTCAGELAKIGYNVTVFEALHACGGVLMYGIPQFRLPKEIVRKEISALADLGVRFENNVVIGKTITIDELFEEEGFGAAFIGTGAGLPSFLGIPGESLNGVYSANEFLTRVNLMKAYNNEFDTPVLKAKAVAVVGGGNVAMDAARCAKRLGAESVSIIYRRSLDEMPARKEEIHHAMEEGIKFDLLTNPVKILGTEKGSVMGIECERMELGEPDASGRRRPVKIEDSEFVTDCDCVIIAIGTTPNPLIGATTPGLELNRHGCVVATPETGATSREGVFAGGDIVSGAATVILAMGAGKAAAKSIDEYLSKK
jgi:glutamate synthase (NADPH/NADH) small chain